MEISEETAKALYDYISHVKFATRKCPEEPVSRIWDCACMGPLPECRCAKMQRLVREFMESVDSH